MTYDNLELLFLPVLRLNEVERSNKRDSNATFLVAVDAQTEDNDGSTTTLTGVGKDSAGDIRQGFIFGETLNGAVIKIDQGLDTTEISPKRRLDADLIETSFTVQIDNRLGKLVDTQGTEAAPDFIDDDNIAYYTVDLGDTFVSQITNDSTGGSEVIRGPRGTRMEFRIKSSLDLNTSTFLFEQLGSTTTMDNRTASGTSNVFFIDTNVKITGMKTGAQIDVPVRYVKLAE